MNKHSVALILDDHPLFSSSFASMIEKMNLFDQVETFSDDSDLFKYIIRNDHHIIFLFLDYYLRDKTSLHLIKDARRIVKNIRIIVVSSVSSPGLVRSILAHKPNGFISKSSDFNIVIQCLKAVEKKQLFLCPIISELFQDAPQTEDFMLTKKELEILKYFHRGYSIEQTAEIANLSKHTIVAHRRNMMAKANCKSITELLWYATEYGLI